jgi:hypothetical protein
MSRTLEQTSWNFMWGEGVDWENDADLFFGPLTPDEFVNAMPGDMIDILVTAGVFPSKTAARKNGWAADCEPILRWKDRGSFCVVATPGRRVPKGFTLFRCGKGKSTEIAILHIP